MRTLASLFVAVLYCLVVAALFAMTASPALQKSVAATAPTVVQTPVESAG